MAEKRTYTTEDREGVPSSRSDSGLRTSGVDDEDLDKILPKEGYAIVPPPSTYMPPRPSVHSLRVAETLTQLGVDFEGCSLTIDLRPLDHFYFATLLRHSSDNTVGFSERATLILLLLIKNGSSQQRKLARSFLIDRLRQLGCSYFFCATLPMLTESQLPPKELRTLVKLSSLVIDYLDTLARPYAHKVVLAVQPMLLNRDTYPMATRVLISLTRSTGLATMIAVMRPEITEASDQTSRQLIAHSFAIVAQVVGLPSLMPLLNALCRNTSWQARGCGVLTVLHSVPLTPADVLLPHVRSLVDLLGRLLGDPHEEIRDEASEALAALHMFTPHSEGHCSLFRLSSRKLC